MRSRRDGGSETADRRAARSGQGFTLAELLVSVTLLASVMAAVYTAFSGTARVARLGEENLVTQQRARIALDAMERDLHGILPYTWHLFEGDGSSFELYTLASSMQPELGAFSRMLWVSYRLRGAGQGRGSVLVREEREVEAPLPLKLPDMEEPSDVPIETGRKRNYDLAEGIDGLSIEYIWVTIPPEVELSEGDMAVAPQPAQLVVRQDIPDDWELPQAIRIRMTLLDTSAPSGKRVFTSHVVFRGAPPSVDPDEAEVMI